MCAALSRRLRSGVRVNDPSGFSFCSANMSAKAKALCAMTMSHDARRPICRWSVARRVSMRESDHNSTHVTSHNITITTSQCRVPRTTYSIVKLQVEWSMRPAGPPHFNIHHGLAVINKSHVHGVFIIFTRRCAGSRLRVMSFIMFGETTHRHDRPPVVSSPSPSPLGFFFLQQQQSLRKRSIGAVAVPPLSGATADDCAPWRMKCGRHSSQQS